MEKQTKSIITRRDIHERLNKRFRASLPGLIMICVVLSLMNLFFFAEYWFVYILPILCDVLILAIVTVLIDGVRRLRRTESNDFAIVEDELIDMREELERSGAHRRRCRLKYILYFSEFGKYEVDMDWDGSVWEYSSVGDRFYLVLASNGVIRFVYSQKIYEVRDHV